PSAAAAPWAARRAAFTPAYTLLLARATQNPNNAAGGYPRVFTSHLSTVVSRRNSPSTLHRPRYSSAATHAVATAAGRLVSTSITPSPSRVGRSSVSRTRRTATSSPPGPTSQIVC